MGRKTTEDIYTNGRWLQRTFIDNKYTWTVSGVLWNNIKERCTPNSHTQKRESTYIGSLNKFETYERFVSWNRNQVGYGLGYDLDSDILKQDSKIYSEETCLLIPSALNRFLQSHKRTRTQDLPMGSVWSGSKLWVRMKLMDDVLCKSVDIVNVRVDGENIDLARQLYTEAANKAACIWYDRLANSGQYKVDQKVIDYMKNWRYICDWKQHGI